MKSAIKDEIKKITYNHAFFLFADILTFILPFIFINASMSNISLAFLIIFFSFFVFAKCKLLSKIVDRFSDSFSTTLVLFVISTIVSIAFYACFYSLGYNQAFFRTPICIIILVVCLLIGLGVDLYWLIIWKRSLRK